MRSVSGPGSKGLGGVELIRYLNERRNRIDQSGKWVNRHYESGKTRALTNGIQLTGRQIEVMSLMDQGLSNQQIADALSISKATVKTHVNHLFKIFEANNRIGCLRAAKKEGLLITS